LVLGLVAAIPLLLVRVIWATGGGDAAPLLFDRSLYSPTGITGIVLGLISAPMSRN
jgi:hypothetical protein